MWTNPMIIQIILDSLKDEDDIDTVCSSSESDSSNDEEDVHSDQSNDESRELNCSYLNLFSQ
jgi:hypothetical protein